MLAPGSRLRRSADFTEVVRRGRRASRPLLTVHLLAPPEAHPPSSAPRAGLVVSKAVGGSVVRSRTSRRLRHLLRDRLAALPAGASLVVRAAPGAGSASSAALASDLDAALAKAVRPQAVRTQSVRTQSGRPQSGRPQPASPAGRGTGPPRADARVAP